MGDGEALVDPQKRDSVSKAAELNGDIAANRFFCWLWNNVNQHNHQTPSFSC